MWLKIKDRKPNPNQIIIAYDSIGDSVGIYDGWSFDSFSDGYSWDIEYSNKQFIAQQHTGKIVGEITHWMPLPQPPTSDNSS